jgi:hypothetical protein
VNSADIADAITLIANAGMTNRANNPKSPQQDYGEGGIKIDCL